MKYKSKIMEVEAVNYSMSTVIKTVVRVIPSMKKIMEYMDFRHVSTKTNEDVFILLNAIFYKFFKCKEVSYEEKYQVFRELMVASPSQYTIISERQFIEFINKQRSIAFQTSLSGKTLDEFHRNFFSLFFSVMNRMMKNPNTIDDLLGSTDCNNKYERQYWIHYILEHLPRATEAKLIEIMEFSNTKTNDQDNEIDLEELTLTQLRGIASILRSHSTDDSHQIYK